MACAERPEPVTTDILMSVIDQCQLVPQQDSPREAATARLIVFAAAGLEPDAHTFAHDVGSTAFRHEARAAANTARSDQGKSSPLPFVGVLFIERCSRM